MFKALAADSNCVYAADLLSAQVISAQMLGRARVSLNIIAEQSTIGLIQTMLDAGVQLREVGTCLRGMHDVGADKLLAGGEICPVDWAELLRVQNQKPAHSIFVQHVSNVICTYQRLYRALVIAAWCSCKQCPAAGGGPGRA